MHTCGRMCKDIGVKTTFPRTMGISFRLHPEQSRVHPEQSRVHPERSRVHPERSRGVEVYALDFSSRLRSTNSLSGAEHCTPSEAEGYPIQSRVLHPERSRVLYPERSRVLYPERSRVLYPERSRGVHIHIRFSSRLRSTNSLSMRGIYCKNNAPHFCEASYHFVINLS